MKLFSLAAIVLFTSLPVFSDSVPFTVFVLQPSGNIPLDPNGNPTFQQTLCQSACVFEIGINVPLPSTTTTYTFTYTFTFGNQVFVGNPPFVLTCSPQDNLGSCSVGYGFLADCCNRTPIPGTFTATVNGVSETFHFQYLPLVTPEPATMSLLGTGIVGIAWRKYRQKRQRPLLIRSN